MAYSNGEALVLTRVRDCTSFDENNTSRGNYRILNNGKASTYAILHPGTGTRSRQTPTRVHSTWSTVIEVWQRYTTDEESLIALEDKVAEILTEFDSEPQLGNAAYAVNARINEVREAVNMLNSAGGVTHLKQELIATWIEA